MIYTGAIKTQTRKEGAEMRTKYRTTASTTPTNWTMEIILQCFFFIEKSRSATQQATFKTHTHISLFLSDIANLHRHNPHTHTSTLNELERKLLYFRKVYELIFMSLRQRKRNDGSMNGKERERKVLLLTAKRACTRAKTNETAASARMKLLKPNLLESERN